MKRISSFLFVENVFRKDKYVGSPGGGGFSSFQTFQTSPECGFSAILNLGKISLKWLWPRVVICITVQNLRKAIHIEIPVKNVFVKGTLTNDFGLRFFFRPF